MKKKSSKEEITEVELGTRYKCYKCGTKFYDLGKAQPLCPSCGEDQDNEETRRMLKRKKRRRPSAPGKTEADHAAPQERNEKLETREDEGEYSLDIDDIVLEDEHRTDKSG